MTVSTVIQLIFPTDLSEKSRYFHADKQLYQDIGFFPTNVNQLASMDYVVQEKVLYLTEWNTGDIWLLRLKDSGKLSWRKIISRRAQ